jgi:4-amino-4-deoxy-L-arabinose transferase-like glycosyltransferase
VGVASTARLGKPLFPGVESAPSLLAIFLLFHTVLWTVYASFSSPGPVHRDMIEAYAWGREFQLGYYKHPPFWAWIAGAWFELFPRTNWAFYLLASLNSAIAVAGVWKLNGLFAAGATRLSATLLLLLLPFYTIQGHQFNANYIQLSLWPWTVYFFLLSMVRRRTRDALLFGALAAAGLLSKYYSALLLASCFFASLTHPQSRNYYRSPMPYLSVAMCALLFLPHLVWLFQNGFAPLHYAEEKTAYTGSQIYLAAAIFILGCIGFNSLGLALVIFARLTGRAAPPPNLPGPPWGTPGPRFLTILAFGPFAFTLLASAVTHLKLSTNFASPIFFLVPLWLVTKLRPDPERLQRYAGIAVAILYAGAFLAAPAIPYLIKQQGQDTKHMLGVAREARRLWRDATGLPLKMAAGAEAYAMATAFYSGEDTSTFLGFDLNHSPWVSPASLLKTGFLGICAEDDAICRSRAAAFGGPGLTDSLVHLSGGGVAPITLRVFISPPALTLPRAGGR